MHRPRTEEKRECESRAEAAGWPPPGCCWPGAGAGRAAAAGDQRRQVVLAVLNDQSGIYADTSGRGKVEAVSMAVADYRAEYGDKAVAKTIEVVSADHQNKPEIANSKAQELYDRQNADVILDVPASSAALAVATVAKNRRRCSSTSAPRAPSWKASRATSTPSTTATTATCWPTAPAPR